MPPRSRKITSGYKVERKPCANSLCKDGWMPPWGALCIACDEALGEFSEEEMNDLGTMPLAEAEALLMEYRARLEDERQVVLGELDE